MTNPDMVKKPLRAGPSVSALDPVDQVSPPGAPKPNPPAPVEAYDFQRDPRYPEVDPLDSNQLKPSLDRR